MKKINRKTNLTFLSARLSTRSRASSSFFSRKLKQVGLNFDQAEHLKQNFYAFKETCANFSGPSHTAAAPRQLSCNVKTFLIFEHNLKTFIKKTHYNIQKHLFWFCRSLTCSTPFSLALLTWSAHPFLPAHCSLLNLLPLGDPGPSACLFWPLCM